MTSMVVRAAQVLSGIAIILLAAAFIVPRINEDENATGLLLMGVGVIACLLAIVIGHAAQLVQLRSASPLSLRTPLLTAYLAFGVTILLWAGNEGPRLHEPFQVAESKAIRSVQAVVRAQSAYVAKHQGFACTLAELGVPNTPLRDYALSVQCGSDGRSYQVAAVPTRNAGHRTLCADQTGVLKYALEANAAACFATGPVLQ